VRELPSLLNDLALRCGPSHALLPATQLRFT